MGQKGQNNDNQQNNHQRIAQQQNNQNNQGQENEQERLKMEQNQQHANQNFENEKEEK
jgi:hypothetical protein